VSMTTSLPGWSGGSEPKHRQPERRFAPLPGLMLRTRQAANWVYASFPIFNVCDCGTTEAQPVSSTDYRCNPVTISLA